jgi:hypothetical protein
VNDIESDARPEAENVEPKGGRLKLDFTMHIAQPSRRLLIREGTAPVPAVRRGRAPRVARMLVQAHLFQRMLETGQAADLADLARKFKLTRARVTQISNYTLLAPDIQAEVLAMPPIEPGREPIREPEMRAVLREVLWSEQRKRWRALVRPCVAATPAGASATP